MTRTRTILIIVLTTLVLIGITGVGYYAVRATQFPIRIGRPFDYPFQFQPDPEVGFVRIANLDLKIPIGSKEFRQMRLYTNGQGLRVDRPNAPDYKTADILSIGGSQTLGHGVQAEQTFSQVMGRLLGVTSANLGVDSYGGVTAYARLKQFWRLKPKVIVYGFWPDHEHRNISRCAPSATPFCLAVPHIEFDDSGPRIVGPKSSNVYSMRLSAKYLRAIGTGRQEYPLWQDMYWNFRVDIQKILWKLGWDGRYNSSASAEQREIATRHLLSTLARETQENGAKLVVVFLPDYQGKGPLAAVHSYVPEQLEASGSNLIDMTAEFSNIIIARGRQALMVPEDGHMSALAHRIIARKAAAIIEARGLLK